MPREDISETEKQREKALEFQKKHKIHKGFFTFALPDYLEALQKQAEKRSAEQFELEKKIEETEKLQTEDAKEKLVKLAIMRDKWKIQQEAHAILTNFLRETDSEWKRLNGFVSEMESLARTFNLLQEQITATRKTIEQKWTETVSLLDALWHVDAKTLLERHEKQHEN